MRVERTRLITRSRNPWPMAKRVHGRVCPGRPASPSGACRLWLCGCVNTFGTRCLHPMLCPAAVCLSFPSSSHPIQTASFYICSTRHDHALLSSRLVLIRHALPASIAPAACPQGELLFVHLIKAHATTSVLQESADICAPSPGCSSLLPPSHLR